MNPPSQDRVSSSLVPRWLPARAGSGPSAARHRLRAPSVRRRTRILAGVDRLEHAREPRQIVDIKCRGDVEITWHQFDAVQHCRRGASHHVVDAGFVKNTEQRGHVGWFALRLTFGPAGHL